MGGDLIACPLLLDRRTGAHLCRCRQDPETLRYKPAECVIGIGGSCPWPELREHELRQRQREARLMDRPASFWCRIARRWSGW